MLSRKYIPHKSKKNRKLCIIPIFLIIVSAAVYFGMRGAAVTALEYSARSIATKAITDAVYEVLQSNEINYGALFNVSRGTDGKITSITSNPLEVNKIANNLTSEITDSLSGKKSSVYKVPIGTLIGNELTIGRGFDVPLKIFPLGYADVQIIGKLTNAGINQVCHSLFIRINADFTTVAPVYNSNFNVTQDFLISEAVIVGDIPESYTEISGIDSEKISEFDSLILKNSL